MADRSNKRVSIVVVTFGVKDYIKLCLDSIKKQIYALFEIIVIDNSLNPYFSQGIVEPYPEIKLYSAAKNLFYCAALNLGIETSQGDFILCLNDDVILDKRFIEDGLKGFNIDEMIGMVSGKILRSDGKTIDSTGLFLSLWRTASERGYALKDTGKFEKEGYIFGVNGAVAFYRREMLEAIKVGSDYFDGDYHFFYEDLDIAWRAQSLGWRAYYIPSAIAYHARGASVRARQGIDKPYARRYLNSDLHSDLLKNRYLTLIKNESALSFLLHLPFILSYDILVWIYVLFFKPVLIKKFLLNIKYLNFALQKRKLIKNSVYILKNP